MIHADLTTIFREFYYLIVQQKLNSQTHENNNKMFWYMRLSWMIPPMVVHPEKIDFRRFV